MNGLSLTSPNGRYRFLVQLDLGLEIYDGDQSIWSSRTNRVLEPGTVFVEHRVEMQEDGNVVLYAGNDSPLWATMTNGTPATRLVMQDDGNLVLYGDDGTPYWASETAR